MTPEYLDFELEIGLGQGRDYPVAVLRSPAGEARTTMRFPFDTIQLESRLKDLQIALLRSGGTRRLAMSKEQQAVRDFGQALFDALMTEEVRSLFVVSQDKAGNKGLRIKLRIADPALAALPWEFLYDPRRRDFVCLSTHTPLVRYLELPSPLQPLLVEPPLRVLGMIASPTDLLGMDVAQEKERVERALAGLRADGHVELHWLPGQTWRDLQRTLRHGPWHMFHFVGHGAFDVTTDEGMVMLCDDQGRARPLRASQLGRFLAGNRSLRLAVLNTCEGAKGSDQDIFSSTASVLVKAGLPAVLAMQYEITDRAAIELSRVFYEAIADGLPVDAAVAEARIAVSTAVSNTVEWGTPVLYMRASDGMIFNLAHAARKTSVRVAPEEESPRTSEVALDFFAVQRDDEPPKSESGEQLGSTTINIRTVNPSGNHVRLLGFSVFMLFTVIVMVIIAVRMDIIPRNQVTAKTEVPLIITPYGTATSFSTPSPRTPIPTYTPVLSPTPLLARTRFNEVGAYDTSTGSQLVSLLYTDDVLHICARDGNRYLVAKGACDLSNPIGWVVEDNLTLLFTNSFPNELTTPTMPTAEGTKETSITAPDTLQFNDEGASVMTPVSLDLIRLPSGEFLMGSDTSVDRSAVDDELPQHKVNLSEFYIGKYEVTNGQYATFVDATDHRAPDSWDGDVLPVGEKDNPVVQVSWVDAVAFTEWLSEETSMVFRLCTEAEWEKACRGSSGDIYPWGNTFDSSKANTSRSVGKTAPVGTYSPVGDSVYGAADMSGNAWEWVADWYDDSYYEGSPADNPQGSESGELRVLRGGSWYLPERYARCAYRTSNDVDFRSDYLGFRVCMSPDLSLPD